MFLIKLVLKLLALPIMLIATLAQWVGIFVTGFSAWLFNLVAGLMFTVSVLTYFMGIGTGKEVLPMLGVSFAIFIVPYIAEWIITRIAVVNYALRDFIMS